MKEKMFSQHPIYSNVYSKIYFIATLIIFFHSPMILKTGQSLNPAYLILIKIILKHNFFTKILLLKIKSKKTKNMFMILSISKKNLI